MILGYQLDSASTENHHLKFKPEICLSDSGEVFTLNGDFTKKKLTSQKPTLKIISDSKNLPLIWVFFKSGNGDVPSFTLSSIVDGTRTPKIETDMADLKINTELNFTLKISCDSNGFTARFNDEWEETIVSNTSNLNNAIISITGSIEIDHAGFTGEVGLQYIKLCIALLLRY